MVSQPYFGGSFLNISNIMHDVNKFRVLCSVCVERRDSKKTTVPWEVLSAKQRGNRNLRRSSLFLRRRFFCASILQLLYINSTTILQVSLKSRLILIILCCKHFYDCNSIEGQMVRTRDKNWFCQNTSTGKNNTTVLPK